MVVNDFLPMLHSFSLCLCLEAPAVRRDDVFVPPERLLAVARERARAVVVAIDVDEAIALFHLGRRGADEVDAAPCRVAHDGHAVGDGLSDLHEVVVEVLDAIVVIDRLAALAVVDELVVRAETVFDAMNSGFCQRS